MVGRQADNLSLLKSVASEQTELQPRRQWKRIIGMRIAAWNVRTLCVQTDINNCRLQIGQRGQNTTNWKKSIEEGKVRIGL